MASILPPSLEYDLTQSIVDDVIERGVLSGAQVGAKGGCLGLSVVVGWLAVAGYGFLANSARVW